MTALRSLRWPDVAAAALGVVVLWGGDWALAAVIG
jgi:hypothetical protein